MRRFGYLLVTATLRIWNVASPGYLMCIMALLGLLVASTAHAQTVTVEYRMLSESRTADAITQSIEVHVTNIGPDAMSNTSATISAIATTPIGPLGQVLLGEIPVGFTVSQIAELSFSVANEPTVRSSRLLFEFTFFDAAGQQRVISTLSQQVP